MTQIQNRIIAICGPKRVGKSTLAELIRSRQNNYMLTSFAYPIKKMLIEFVLVQGCEYDTAYRMFYSDLKSVPSDYLGGKTPVWTMQTLGTEWGRDLMNKNIWAYAWKNKANKLITRFNIVVDDLRFLTEEEVIRSFDNATIVEVVRTGHESSRHQSESEYMQIRKDIVLYNNSTRDALYEEFLSKIPGAPGQ